MHLSFHAHHDHAHHEENLARGLSKVTDEDENEISENLKQERKTFSYAAHVTTDETARRAPSAPNSKSTGTDKPDHHQKQGPNHAKKKDNWLRKVKHFLFPLRHRSQSPKKQNQKQQRVRGGVLMRGCLTAEEHKAKAKEAVELSNMLYGERGLRAAGFEYRLVLCPKHCESEQVISSSTGTDNDAEALVPRAEEEKDEERGGVSLVDQQKSVDENSTDQRVQDASDVFSSNENKKEHSICQLCSSRLFDIASNTQIDSTNRKSFIADGDMYDAIAKLCQEAAHEVMLKRERMVWVTLCPPEEDDCSNPLKRNPIRALVNHEHPAAQASCDDVTKCKVENYNARPTLLIVTGKGKVRAGIFSRQHIIVSGMESSTALPLIQEARLRKLNVVLLDPNVHGDALGLATFEKSMAKVFHQWESDTSSKENDQKANAPNDPTKATSFEQSCRDLFILSHSASGAHLARYLLEKSQHYLPHIRAIAFTDATHNIQWARQRGNHHLVDLLESPACIYFRCATDITKHHAGEEAPTDNFWRHRFGNIRTCWAGTKEHSLTNWFAHAHIWEHFDKFLPLKNKGQAGVLQCDTIQEDPGKEGQG